MQNARILVRFTAFLLIWAAILLLIRNVVLSYDSFRPSYIGHYFRQELLSPTLILFAGVSMRLRANSICRMLTKHHEKSD